MVDQKHNVIWKPLPGSQELALSCPANHILFHGSRGPGKTDAQLMYFRRFVGQGYGQFWTGVIFDRTYKMLDDLIKKSQRWFPKFKDGARFIKGDGLRWVWPTGESLLFRHMKNTKDYENYHGHEYPFIGWNELTKHPTSELYDMMMSCNRSSFLPSEHSPDTENPLKPIPLAVFSTTNPHGPGHVWVKRRFVDPAPPGKMQLIKRKVFNPQTSREEEITKTQVHLFGSYKENRFLSPEYVLELDSIKDDSKRRAWLKGDWDIDAGGALEGVWDRKTHVVPRFKVPRGWRLDRSMDWGSTHPFSVGFWAVANGEELEMPDGRKWAPVKGSIFRIAELYGSEEIGTNKGNKMSARNLAKAVKKKQKDLKDGGWVDGRFNPGPADNQIFSVVETESNSISSIMLEEGVEWTKSDKRPGSRKAGLQLLRDALENSSGVRSEDGSVSYEKPGLYFMDNCGVAITTLPTLPRDEDDPDDIDTTSEDHAYDEVRYRILNSSKDFATTIKTSFV